MQSLAELIGREISPESKERHSPKIETLTRRIPKKTKKLFSQYEIDVFNFLFLNKDALQIKAVNKFTALLVDSAIELNDGKRLTVEVKYRMNWEKACQAEWQFRTLMKTTDPKLFSVEGGIVIFDEFSGDWDRKAGPRLLKNGWSHWYRGHAEVDGFRLDLLRFHDDELTRLPIGDAHLSRIQDLPAEKATRFFDSVSKQNN